MPSQERAKLRPVPRDPHLWAKEVDGIRAFLDRVGAYAEVWGQGWVERMREYYQSRLELLLASPPKSSKKGPTHGRHPKRSARR